jgi:hypothetical protein
MSYQPDNNVELKVRQIAGPAVIDPTDPSQFVVKTGQPFKIQLTVKAEGSATAYLVGTKWTYTVRADENGGPFDSVVGTKTETAPNAVLNAGQLEFEVPVTIDCAALPSSGVYVATVALTTRDSSGTFPIKIAGFDQFVLQAID